MPLSQLNLASSMVDLLQQRHLQTSKRFPAFQRFPPRWKEEIPSFPTAPSDIETMNTIGFYSDIEMEFIHETISFDAYCIPFDGVRMFRGRLDPLAGLCLMISSAATRTDCSPPTRRLWPSVLVYT